jgi:hypothetical protein
MRVPSLSAEHSSAEKGLSSRLNLRFCSPVHNTVRATRKSQEEEKEEEEEETVAVESGSRSDSQTPNTAMTF